MTDSRLNYEEIRKRAEKRVKRQVGFLWHLAAYLCVNLFMWGQWFTIANNPDRFPLLVTLGWGIGLAMHGINVFFKSRLMDRLNDQAFEREIALEKQRLRMVGQDDSIEEKPKRKSRPMTVRLTDDGELADVEEDYSAASHEDGQNRG